MPGEARVFASLPPTILQDINRAKDVPGAGTSQKEVIRDALPCHLLRCLERRLSLHGPHCDRGRDRQHERWPRRPQSAPSFVFCAINRATCQRLCEANPYDQKEANGSVLWKSGCAFRFYARSLPRPGSSPSPSVRCSPLAPDGSQSTGRRSLSWTGGFPPPKQSPVAVPEDVVDATCQIPLRSKLVGRFGPYSRSFALKETRTFKAC